MFRVDWIIHFFLVLSLSKFHKYFFTILLIRKDKLCTPLSLNTAKTPTLSWIPANENAMITGEKGITDISSGSSTKWDVDFLLWIWLLASSQTFFQLWIGALIYQKMFPFLALHIWHGSAIWLPLSALRRSSASSTSATYAAILSVADVT